MEPRNLKRMLIGAIVIALVAGFWFFVLRNPEPAYNGKRLSEWLHHRGGASFAANSGRHAGDEAALAIRAMGTNALPYLISAIAFEPHWIRRLVMTNSSKLPNVILRNQRFNRW